MGIRLTFCLFTFKYLQLDDYKKSLFFQIKPLFEQAEAKNKLLRSVAGGGVDSLNHLLARWDKFELMMESHQLMVKEQVISLWW